MKLVSHRSDHCDTTDKRIASAILLDDSPAVDVLSILCSSVFKRDLAAKDGTSVAAWGPQRPNTVGLAPITAINLFWTFCTQTPKAHAKRSTSLNSQVCAPWREKATGEKKATSALVAAALFVFSRRARMARTPFQRSTVKYIERVKKRPTQMHRQICLFPC